MDKRVLTAATLGLGVGGGGALKGFQMRAELVETIKKIGWLSRSTKFFQRHAGIVGLIGGAALGFGMATAAYHICEAGCEKTNSEKKRRCHSQ